MPITNPTLALGLSGIADYAVELPFLDIMRQATLFYAQDTSTCSGASVDAHSLGATSLTVLAAGTGSIPVGAVVNISGDSTRYLVTGGVANVAVGGTLTIEQILGGPSDGMTTASATSKTLTMRSQSAYDYDALVARNHIGVDGWPTSIPTGMNSITWNWAFPNGTPGTEGPFVMTWTGTGTITTSSVTVTSSAAHRVVFTNAETGSITMNITATDGGDPIKDIRIVQERYEALADLGEPFNPDWLDTIGSSRSLRFMDWMDTNFSSQSAWADRPLVGDVTYTRRGAPVEIMVALANKAGIDPWFTFPHLCTDEYVEEFATYVEANLNDGLTAYFEYSNETWNSAFGQTSYMTAQGVAAGWTTGSDYSKGQKWAGYRMAQCSEIVREVFGEDSGGRWVGVLSTWPSVVSQTDNRLVGVEQHISADAPPVGTTVNDLFSFVATTTYFGTSVVGDVTKRDELLAYIAAHTTEETYDWLAGKLMDPAYSSSILDTSGNWDEQIAFIASDMPGLGLIAYEGGQHVHQSFSVSGIPAEDLTTLTNFLSGFVRSDQMADLYGELWDAWVLVSDGPFMHFTDVEVASQFGSWGLLADLTDTNPRAELLFDRNDTVASWFGDGGGTHYVPKTVAALTDGQSVTIGARGGTVAGTTGKERVNVPGPASDYTVARNAGTGVYTLSKSGFELVLSVVDGIRYGA